DRIVPGAEIAPPLPDVVQLHAHLGGELPLEADNELIGARRTVVTRDAEILGAAGQEEIHDLAGGGVIGPLIVRLHVGNDHVREFAGGDLRMVTTPRLLDDRLAVTGDLEVRAQARRDAGPREEISARERLAGRVGVVVQFLLSRREGLAVIDAHADVQRQSITDPYAVVDEGTDVAGGRGIAEGLPHVAVAVQLAAREIRVDEIVVAVNAGNARLVVLDAEMKVLLGAEEAVGMVRQLASRGRAA